MIEELIFQLGYLAIALLGCQQFAKAIAKWSVLLAASTWPIAEATLTDAQVSYTESSRLIDDPLDVLDHTYYHRVDIGPIVSTVTDRYYFPRLRFTYDHRGQPIATDNLAPHNRRALYFNRDDVTTLVEQYKHQRTFSIRYHPRRPGNVFIGHRHFPYWWTALQTVIGLFLILALSLTVEFILGQLGIEEPRIGDRVLSIYVIPSLALVYALWRIIAARV